MEQTILDTTRDNYKAKRLKGRERGETDGRQSGERQGKGLPSGM